MWCGRMEKESLLDRANARKTDVPFPFLRPALLVRPSSGSAPLSGKKERCRVILIQVDGLSHDQLKKALSAGRMPFVYNLVSGSAYHLKPCYSGIPSATPAFQGELFYSVKTCVPAFEFYDRSDGERKAMFQPAVSRDVSERLENLGTPLLSGGTAYSHIFSGGALEARYCADRVSMESDRKSVV